MTLPVRFTRLRLQGFKSFAEPTLVDIRPGLTGIVGPNGCGKSNVIEALRWAMGETSARSLRGGEMEDVIFAGSTSRAGRSHAEVAILLDAADGAAPPPWQEAAELEVVRRIEKGQGSAYRVNGREVRARDVQILFADLVTGAHSPGLVSQGRVAALIAQKPAERRVILEEAAGTAGLHARRHEAELKLRAAEMNLSRAEDVIRALDAQIEALARAAKQAARYRDVAARLRASERELCAIRLARAGLARDAAEAALAEARATAEHRAAEAQATDAQAIEAGLALPGLREVEAAARTDLERVRIERAQVEAEAERAAVALREAETRFRQIEADRARAAKSLSDALAARARLEAERATLDGAVASDPDALAALELSFRAATDARARAESEAERLTQSLATISAEARSLDAASRASAATRSRIGEAEAALVRDEATFEAARADVARLPEAEAALESARGIEAEARTRLAASEAARSQAAEAREAASRVSRDAETKATRLRAEVDALGSLLGSAGGELWPPLVDAVEVPEGLETALGAALGEALADSADEAAPRHWRALPPFDPVPELPLGARSLASLVRAPAALARALSQVGVVEEECDPAALQRALAPGQSLVSRSGAVWRWDGWQVASGTPTPAAERLRQRNRLAALLPQLAQAEAEARDARAASQATDAAAHAASAEENAARAALRDASARLGQASETQARLAAKAEATAARSAAILERRNRIERERAEADAEAARLAEARAALPAEQQARTELDAARVRLGRARDGEASSRAAHEQRRREAETRAARLATLGPETDAWLARETAARSHEAELGARLAEAEAAVEERQGGPARIRAARELARAALEAAEAKRLAAADALAAAEASARAKESAARDAAASKVAARERLVRVEAELEGAIAAASELGAAVVERLGEAAATLEAPADASAEAEGVVARRIERLTREREGMGAVNLAADAETVEVEARRASILSDRDDLLSAIAKLRSSIGHLNREGRERVQGKFEEVDRHFRDLFTRLFGGGEAHLALVDSDDPLQAGLEIFASPPGKKLASLSLLSGGEQALTALALIFAVFLTNPSPICVLDEVDAPLDDANVERFCDLIEWISRETGTRFLVVTHHRMTMSKMHRLFGVTMAERGISRLVSVDLEEAAAMVEETPLAAE